MYMCIFCAKQFLSKRGTSIHQTFCTQNSARKIKESPWNKQLTKLIDTRIANSVEKLQNTIKSKSQKHGVAGTDEKEILRCSKISETAKKRGLSGGYRKNAGRSKKFQVYDSYGNATTLQSSYELDVSEILSELSINWMRPKALKYKGKNYFADFYLPDFDIWLDPKNDYKAKLDQSKIDSVIRENNIKLFILLKSQITKSYISRLVIES